MRRIAHRVGEELNAMGDCRAIPGDLSTMAVSRESQVRSGHARARLDILINNAGNFAAQADRRIPEDLLELRWI